MCREEHKRQHNSISGAKSKVKKTARRRRAVFNKRCLLFTFYRLFLGFSGSFGVDNEFLENRISCFFEQDLSNSARRLSAFANPLFRCFAVYFTCICVWIKPPKNAFETSVCRFGVFGQDNSKKCFLVSTSSGKSNFEHTTKG